MKLQYSNTETYSHSIDKDTLELLALKYNRSKTQVLFLFQLVDGNFELLDQLELKIKNCFIFYCPENKDQVTEILSLTPTKVWYQFN
jgi:hypothetical protein